jgi:thiamine-phosphate pyrophosphorylase
MLRPGSIIGGSINSLDDIEYYSTSGVAYCGIGPLRSSSTKSNLRTHLGADRIVELARVLTSKMGIPGYAVGGVTVDDIAPLLSRGVYGVAVSAAIHSKSRVEVQRLLDVVQSFEAQGLSTAFDKELSAS